MMQIECRRWPWYRLDLWLIVYPYQWLRYSLPYRLRKKVVR